MSTSTGQEDSDIMTPAEEHVWLKQEYNAMVERGLTSALAPAKLWELQRQRAVDEGWSQAHWDRFVTYADQEADVSQAQLKQWIKVGGWAVYVALCAWVSRGLMGDRDATAGDWASLAAVTALVASFGYVAFRIARLAYYALLATESWLRRQAQR